jgi:hypothetical protein
VYLAFFFFCILVSSCSSFNIIDKEISSNIETLDGTTILSQTVLQSGGRVLVSVPGSVIDGMEIIVPDGGYKSAKTFSISTSDIVKHSFGPNFIPITPLINIDNGGSYAGKVMEITIPINLPEGYIPTAFFYDKVTGRLEGIPFKTYTANSITLLTRHFMSTSAFYENLGNTDQKSVLLGENSSANIVVCHIDQEELENKSIVTSGFVPGTDDWEFPNWCSYIEPYGICSGMSVSSIWYYHKRLYRGGKSLYNNFDTYNKHNLPSYMWQDNPLGYRFASVIQSESSFNSFVIEMETQFNTPQKVFLNFVYLLLVTNEPQLICVRNKSTDLAHAMVVYKANMREGTLYISDPNFPNNKEPYYGTSLERVIKFQNGLFEPYDIATYAGANSVLMEQVGYFGETAFIDWVKIGEHYGKFDKKTVGNDMFPSYILKAYKDGKYESLDDGFVSSGDTLRCFVDCAGAEITKEYDGMNLIGFAVFRDDKEIFRSSDGLYTDILSPDVLLLTPGTNKLGFYIFAKKRVWENGVVVEREFYLDFKWVEISNSKLRILPIPLVGKPGVELILTASLGEKMPANTKFSWDFGDGSPKVSILNDSIVKHTFSNEGKYSVKVELVNNSTGKKIDEAIAIANISNPRDVITLGSISMSISPVPSVYGDVKIEHSGNKLIATHTLGTYIHTAEISWLTPPSGNYEIADELFMKQIFDFKFSVTRTGGSASFPGCAIKLWGLNTNSAWYDDWQLLNETAVGFYTKEIEYEKILGVTAGKSTAEASIEMPILINVYDSGSEVNVDGRIVFNGFISNFWGSGDNLSFVVNYTYSD